MDSDLIVRSEFVQVYLDKEARKVFLFGKNWKANFGKPFGSMLAGFGLCLSKFSTDYLLELWLGPFAMEFEWLRN